ncbi:GNAT family N-acetyltransferase [Marinomonas sp. C2222]|uniref:GNAT family N-acetyltransferase n=1 Tax=Marinomonas sargassi TaxID=2984494 RepID=A0ABT2YTE0_9GAMM|nr:GNAT family N-acetyltransferase [Marinomonas sargassi]MCV2403143.1 GNAT family N-acetyltransferase [Marinomonas sargassi]
MNYREMTINDYEEVMSVWAESEGLKLRDADSKEGIHTYLERNPDLSFVAVSDNCIVGTIMSGHDGKRGYIQHLSVLPAYRNQGVAKTLVDHALASLKGVGISKSHIHVLADNVQAKAFWIKQGWLKRDDIETYSYINGSEENA